MIIHSQKDMLKFIDGSRTKRLPLEEIELPRHKNI